MASAAGFVLEALMDS